MWPTTSRRNKSTIGKRRSKRYSCQYDTRDLWGCKQPFAPFRGLVAGLFPTACAVG